MYYILLKFFYQVDKSETSALVYATQGGHLNVVSHLLSCDWSTDPVNDLGLAEAAQQAMVAAAQGGHEQVKMKSFSTIDNFYIKLPI